MPPGIGKSSITKFATKVGQPAGQLIKGLDIEKTLAQHGAGAVQSLVDIQIAKTEKSLTEQIEAKREEITATQAEITKLTQLRDKSIKDDVTNIYGAKLAAAESAIAAIFGKTKGRIDINPDSEAREAKIGISINYGEPGGYRSQMNTSSTIAFGKEALGYQGSIDTTVSLKAKQEAELNDLRRKLAKIPQYERQIRGYLGERRFSSTAEGQALLAELDALKL